MPQFHPARDLRDVYYIKEPNSLQSLPEPYFSNVKAVHEMVTLQVQEVGDMILAKVFRKGWYLELKVQCYQQSN